MVKVNEKLYVINSERVVVDEIESFDKYVKLSEGDKILRKGTLQYLRDTVDVKYHFIKLNPNVYGRYANQYPILNSLVVLTGYMDGILSYKNGKVIQIKDLPKICNKSESTVKRQLKGLIHEDIIHKVKMNKKTVLLMNPFVAMRGKRIYLSLYEEFKLSALRNECDEWEK